MLLSLWLALAGFTRLAKRNGNSLLLRLAGLHLSFNVGRDGLLRATFL